MTMNELMVILDQHKKWLNNEDGGIRADLSGANLHDAWLCHADLRDANLCGANLCGAHIMGANLRRAKLCHADLCGADLYGADLRHADLCEADLHGVDLRRANLSGADLYGVDLCDANLQGAVLRGADLQDADLLRANLSGANLCGVRIGGANLCYAVLRHANLHGVNLRRVNLRDVNLRGAKNLSDLFWTSIVPETGSFIGWKKVNTTDMSVIIKLEILADAKRCNATGRKCRCSAAKVLEIQQLDGTPAGLDSVTNTNHTPHVTYRVGKTVLPDSFDDDRWNEHGHGIHFFITRQEAVAS